MWYVIYGTSVCLSFIGNILMRFLILLFPTIQLRMLREWIGQLPETKIYHNDASLPPLVAHNCERQDIYLLERQLTGGDFTTNSPLSGIIG